MARRLTARSRANQRLSMHIHQSQDEDFISLRKMFVLPVALVVPVASLSAFQASPST